MSKITIDASSVDEAVIFMSRMFDAPREKVWEAFTRSEHVANWFGGHGFTTRVVEMDVRPGGKWRLVMRMPDGQEYPMDFVYVDVKKPEKLVWENIDHSSGAASTPGRPTCRQTVTLEDHGAQTKWSLVAKFNSIADRDFAKNMGFAEMITQGCERLNDIVKAL